MMDLQDFDGHMYNDHETLLNDRKDMINNRYFCHDSLTTFILISHSLRSNDHSSMITAVVMKEIVLLLFRYPNTSFATKGACIYDYEGSAPVIPNRASSLPCDASLHSGGMMS